MIRASPEFVERRAFHRGADLSNGHASHVVPIAAHWQPSDERRRRAAKEHRRATGDWERARVSFGQENTDLKTPVAPVSSLHRGYQAEAINPGICSKVGCALTQSNTARSYPASVNLVESHEMAWELVSRRCNGDKFEIGVVVCSEESQVRFSPETRVC